MIKAVCIHKETGEVWEMDMPKHEGTLSALLQSGKWNCYDEDGNEIKAPELEVHPVKCPWMHYSGWELKGIL